MKRAIDETTRRRQLQENYNKKHGITPQTIIKAISETRLNVQRGRNSAPVRETSAYFFLPSPFFFFCVMESVKTPPGPT